MKKMLLCEDNMSPTTPRFPNDPMDYDLPPHTDWRVPAGVAFLPQTPLLRKGLTAEQIGAIL